MQQPLSRDLSSSNEILRLGVKSKFASGRGVKGRGVDVLADSNQLLPSVAAASSLEEGPAYEVKIETKIQEERIRELLT